MDAAAVMTKALELAGTYPEAYYRKPFEAECGYLMGTVVENSQVIGHGCIIGQAIANLAGEVPDWLSGNALAGVDTLWTLGYLVGTDQELQALAVLQNANDEGEPWRVCAKLAREELLSPHSPEA